MTIDWTKPIETEDGRPARVLATDFKRGDAPVLVAVTDDGDMETAHIYAESGTCMYPSGPILRNVPETVTRCHTSADESVGGRGHSIPVLEIRIDHQGRVIVHPVETSND